jgi:hypothetical protein
MELDRLVHHDSAIARSIEGGNHQPNQLPGARRRGKGENDSRGRSREDVDPGRVENEGANTVSIAIHRDPDALFALSVSVGSSEVRDLNALSRLELSPPDVDGEKPAESHGLETHSPGVGRDLGRSRRIPYFGLRGVPSPEGGRLKKESAAFGNPERPGLVGQREPDSFSGARDGRAFGIQVRSTAAVSGVSRRLQVIDEALVGVELRVPGSRRLSASPEEQEQDERTIPSHHY